ncbi:hypothetical protein C8R43DRAFT_1183835, partial [Mycena crocata]
MTKYGLKQLVKKGMPMFFSVPHNTWSTIDLVFASNGWLADNLVKCWTSHGHGSDHKAIRVRLSASVVHRDAPLRRNLRGADWKEFPARLETHMAANPLPPLPLTTPASIDAYTEAFTHNMVSAITDFIPLSHACPFTHRWWSK